MESEVSTSNTQILVGLHPPPPPSYQRSPAQPVECAVDTVPSRQEVSQGLKILVSVHEKMADMSRRLPVDS